MYRSMQTLVLSSSPIIIKEVVKHRLHISSVHNKVCYFRLDHYYFKSIKPVTVTYK